MITIRPLTIMAEKPTPVDPYNPLGLPPNTVRVRTSDGQVPTKANGANYETATLVPGTTNVYDVYKSGSSFAYLLSGSTNLVEALGANTTGITNMTEMFAFCGNLTTAPLFDTSIVTMINFMFYECHSLTSIPLFNTSNVTNMEAAFYNCLNVQSGALALYQQASSQANPPRNHEAVFYNCGRYTTTGAAELALIPEDWKQE